MKKAIAWLKQAGGELRNERLAPFSAISGQVWAMLRQESNVELGPVTLAGSGPARKVSLDVTVDGVPGAALSVMSQGELHALGLALFLLRATAGDSPFGFIMIDDPVQSMDPSKVDGLARLLADVARTRQVIVFTHDDRLPAAIRQLQLPATIWAVTRREHSVVSLTPGDDPVHQYIDDALALALFDDAERGGEVKPELDRLGRRTGAGQVFVPVFEALNSGTHEPYGGGLKELARDTEKLAKALRR